MWLLLVEKALRRLVGEHFSIVPKRKEGVIRYGEFTEVDFSDHEVVDKKKALIVDKGKYKFIPRESWKQTHDPDTSVQAIVDNSQSSFDEFWSDEGLVSEYLVEGRQAFYREVLKSCETYLYGRVVDIGCGPGYVVKALSSSGVVEKLYGVDFSSASIKRCRKEIPGGQFFMGDIYHIACADGIFDAVVCMETLEHLESPTEALRELFRVCRKGGHIIITIPNGALDEYVGHLNFWTEQEFRSLLSNEKSVTFRYCQGQRAMLFVVENTVVERA